MKKAVGISNFQRLPKFKDMTKVIKEDIHTNEMEAIQQSKETGEAKWLGLFTDNKGQWINKKLYKKGKLIMNEIINLSNSIVL